MSENIYHKLVDLYAGHELPEELETELEWQAMGDPALNHEMTTLRRTADLLKADNGVEFTEESFQRILQKVYLRSGADLAPRAPQPVHLQYQLPIQG